MDDDKAKVLEAIAHRDALILRDHGPGAVEMERCPLCGFMRLRCCRPSEPNSVSMTEMSSITECPRCDEIHRRAPEVFRWVMGCVTYIRMLGAQGSLS
jgi:hypothetical protein